MHCIVFVGRGVRGGAHIVRKIREGCGRVGLRWSRVHAVGREQASVFLRLLSGQPDLQTQVRSLPVTFS